MNQLNLFIVRSTTATEIIYEAAGAPAVESQEQVTGADCYWCGQPILGLARPLKSLSATFADAAGKWAAAPESSHLCAACGWVISDKICLPLRVAERMLDKALAGNGRLSFARYGVAERALVALDAGALTVWGRPKAKVEKAWDAAGRTDVPGIECWGIYSRPDAISRVGGKFRNFISYADDSGIWEMYTKAERPQILARLLEPHQGLWTMAIGDGQKHAAIYAPVSDGTVEIQSVFLQGHGQVVYSPDDLRDCLDAVERLVFAGATNDEIEAGKYKGRATMSWRLAYTTHEPTLRMYRGFGILPLALWLRRSVKDLREAWNQ